MPPASERLPIPGEGHWLLAGDVAFHVATSGEIDFSDATSGSASAPWRLIGGVALRCDDGVVVGGKMAVALGLVGLSDGDARSRLADFAGENDLDPEGRWITVNGQRIHITSGDEIDAGGHPALRSALEQGGLAAQLPEGTRNDTKFPGEKELDSLQMVKQLGGSTGAKLVEDGQGNRFVLKKGANPGHLREEDACDRVYRALGVAVPDSKVYETPDGPVKLSKFLDGAKVMGGHLDDAKGEALRDKLKQHFAADALLGNWDVIGMSYDNVMVTKTGEPVRIDNGGSMRYRAQGEMKTPDQWNGTVGEIDSLRGIGRGSKSAQAVFRGLSDQEVKTQVHALLGKKDAVLKEVDGEVADVLKQRFAYLEKRFGSGSGKAAEFVNPYHGVAGRFTHAGDETAKVSLPGREHLYRKRDLHAEGEWPDPTPQPKVYNVASQSLRHGDTAVGEDGTRYQVTRAGDRGSAGDWNAKPDDAFRPPARALGRRLDDAGKATGPEVKLNGSFRVTVPGVKPKKSYGGVLFNDQGHVLLRRPTKAYDGYEWTWAKGGPKAGQHHADAALSEVAEETGHKGKIVGHVPGVFSSHPTSASYFYLMHSSGHDPKSMDDETEETRWVHPDEARKLISTTTNHGGRARDLKVLDAAVNAYRKLTQATTPLRLRGGAVPDSQPPFRGAGS